MNEHRDGGDDRAENAQASRKTCRRFQRSSGQPPAKEEMKTQEVFTDRVT